MKHIPITSKTYRAYRRIKIKHLACVRSGVANSVSLFHRDVRLIIRGESEARFFYKAYVKKGNSPFLKFKRRARLCEAWKSSRDTRSGRAEMKNERARARTSTCGDREVRDQEAAERRGRKKKRRSVAAFSRAKTRADFIQCSYLHSCRPGRPSIRRRNFLERILPR